MLLLQLLSERPSWYPQLEPYRVPGAEGSESETEQPTFAQVGSDSDEEFEILQ